MLDKLRDGVANIGDADTIGAGKNCVPGKGACEDQLIAAVAGRSKSTSKGVGLNVAKPDLTRACCFGYRLVAAIRLAMNANFAANANGGFVGGQESFVILVAKSVVEKLKANFPLGSLTGVIGRGVAAANAA